MEYAELTSEQKATIAATEINLRSLTAQAAKLLTSINVLCLDYATNSQSIIASLDSGELIPNTSGLTGAQPLTTEEFVRLIGGFVYLVDTTSGYEQPQFRADRIKACGINALL